MRIFLVFIALFSVLAEAKDLDDVDTIRVQIESALEEGDTREAVEAFLKKTSWLYSYDAFANRYQAIPKEGTAECKGRNFLLWLMYDCGIQIYLKFSESGG